MNSREFQITCSLISPLYKLTKVKYLFLKIHSLLLDTKLILTSGLAAHWSKNQSSKEKWCWARKDCFIQEAGKLYSGSFETNVSKTIFPFQKKPKSFKGEGMEEGKGGCVQDKQVPRALFTSRHDSQQTWHIGGIYSQMQSLLIFWESLVLHPSRPVVFKSQGKQVSSPVGQGT